MEREDVLLMVREDYNPNAGEAQQAAWYDWSIDFLEEQLGIIESSAKRIIRDIIKEYNLKNC